MSDPAVGIPKPSLASATDSTHSETETIVMDLEKQASHPSLTDHDPTPTDESTQSLDESTGEKADRGADEVEKKDKPRAADGSEVIVVDWEGDDDPLFPKNWPRRTRMGATLIVSAYTFLS